MNVDLSQQKSEWNEFLSTSTGKRFIEHLEIKHKTLMSQAETTDQEESFACVHRAASVREIKSFIDDRVMGKEKVLERFKRKIRK